jgi:hypothetical protein
LIDKLNNHKVNEIMSHVREIHTANPIDPSPKIATVDPGSTPAVFQAALTPTNGSFK